MATVQYFTGNNQPKKQAGMTKGGWDRLHDRPRTLREHDGNDEPRAEGNDNDDDEYDENGNIPDNSAPPAESIACLRPESQRASMPSR